MSALGVIRPNEWELPLFLHVLGAMLLVGALVTAAWFLISARRSGSFDGVRWGWRTLLLGALPAYLLMRIAAEWISSEEGLGDPDPAWINIGFITTDAGALLLIAALVGTGLVVRRAGQAGAGADPAAPAAAGSRGVTVAVWATSILIAAYVVAIWAMTTKPV